MTSITPLVQELMKLSPQPCGLWVYELTEGVTIAMNRTLKPIGYLGRAILPGDTIVIGPHHDIESLLLTAISDERKLACMRRYWDDAYFAILVSSIGQTRDDLLVRDFFQPIFEGIWRGYRHLWPDLDHDDAHQDAMLKCFELVRLWDPSRGRAYSLFTRSLFNHLHSQQKRVARVRTREVPMAIAHKRRSSRRIPGEG